MVLEIQSFTKCLTLICLMSHFYLPLNIPGNNLSKVLSSRKLANYRVLKMCDSKKGSFGLLNKQKKEKLLWRKEGDGVSADENSAELALHFIINALLCLV